jgi:5'-3' exonuclease
MSERFRVQYFDVPTNSELEALSSYGEYMAEIQRGVNWWIGDIARYAEARFPDTWHQAFPYWISPGLVDRCKAVSRAYPKEEDRNPQATWAIHMKFANKPDRIALVQASVDKGQTTDEVRQETAKDLYDRRWLLAVDVNYFLHRFWFSGAGVEAAVGVASWVQRTVERLKEKGLTDVACCFDSKVNHRKELTKGWEDRYKDRPPKDPELVQQLILVRELLEGHNFACVSLEGFEADDIMASFGAQFDGRVTLMSQDKDVRQCLSERCNILLDVDWSEDETSGDMLPDYKWLSAKAHTEATGILPSQWTEYQSLMGDTVDGVKGAIGIGEKGAADLIREFGNCEAAIQAAKDGDESIKPKKREALIEFEDKLDVTRQLVTLRTDLEIPSNTRV